ncbi:hypothetical protein M2157_003170 [Streptomyces sp. SAI-127]|nr:hypothetical protein [Streptomyces sp. SAI-127]
MNSLNRSASTELCAAATTAAWKVMSASTKAASQDAEAARLPSSARSIAVTSSGVRRRAARRAAWTSTAMRTS